MNAIGTVRPTSPRAATSRCADPVAPRPSIRPSLSPSRAAHMSRSVTVNARPQNRSPCHLGDRTDQLDDHLAGPKEHLRGTVAELADAARVESERGVRGGGALESSVNTTRWSSSVVPFGCVGGIDVRCIVASVQAAMPCRPDTGLSCADDRARHRAVVVDGEPCRAPGVGVAGDVEADEYQTSRPTSAAYSSSLRQHAIAIARRQTQHDLVDADRRVVLELARDREPCRTARCAASRIAADGLARACSAGSAARMPAPPIGIQPSAYSAMWANNFGPAAPPINTGGPPDAPASATTTTAGCARARRRTTRRRRATALSSRARARARRRAVPSSSTPWSAISSSFQPKPMPSTNRPPDSWSSVATAFAVTIGSRCATRQMPVPTRSRSVTAAAIDSATNGSSVRLYSSRELGVARRRRRDAGSSECACAPARRASASPRSSTARASSTGPIVRSVMNIVTPNFIGRPCCQLPTPPSEFGCWLWCRTRAGHLRRTDRHRHRRRPRHRPRARARVRGRRRARRRERSRRRARRHRHRRRARGSTSSTRSSPAGGEAIANTDDIADWDGARRLVAHRDRHVRRPRRAREQRRFPARPHGRSRPSEDEWDAVIRVHLKGHFATTRHATEWWRARSRRPAPRSTRRIVNTSSGAGLMGSVGQGAYSAAKAGIAALTLVEAAEMARYGVTANAIAPAARTRMTEEVFGERMAGARRRLRPQRPRATSRRSSCGSAAPSRATSPAACSRSRAA